MNLNRKSHYSPADLEGWHIFITNFVHEAPSMQNIGLLLKGGQVCLSSQGFVLGKRLLRYLELCSGAETQPNPRPVRISKLSIFETGSPPVSGSPVGHLRLEIIH